jgi:hypothetical protein
VNGYKITPANRRSLAGFRRALARAESELKFCPPGCTIDHDAGKTPGRDHWKPWPAKPRS